MLCGWSIPRPVAGRAVRMGSARVRRKDALHHTGSASSPDLRASDLTLPVLLRAHCMLAPFPKLDHDDLASAPSKWRVRK